MLKIFVNQPSTSSALGFFCQDLSRRSLLLASHPPLDLKINSNFKLIFDKLSFWV